MPIAFKLTDSNESFSLSYYKVLTPIDFSGTIKGHIIELIVYQKGKGLEKTRAKSLYADRASGGYRRDLGDNGYNAAVIIQSQATGQTACLYQPSEGDCLCAQRI